MLSHSQLKISLVYFPRFTLAFFPLESKQKGPVNAFEITVTEKHSHNLGPAPTILEKPD